MLDVLTFSIFLWGGEVGSVRTARPPHQRARPNEGGELGGVWDAHEAACERRDRPAHVNPVVDKARGAGVGAGAGVEGLGDFLPALVRDDRDGGGVQGHGRQEESAQGRGVGGYGRVPAGGGDGGRGNDPHGEAVPRHPVGGGGGLRLACACRR